MKEMNKLSILIVWFFFGFLEKILIFMFGSRWKQKKSYLFWLLNYLFQRSQKLQKSETGVDSCKIMTNELFLPHHISISLCCIRLKTMCHIHCILLVAFRCPIEIFKDIRFNWPWFNLNVNWFCPFLFN